ncbi:coat protein [Salvia divinorum RNA virus 1]|uniref:coat protein n=1 Tax=Salvia divinorum RNA virus 1 TaxID=2419804 RepID=UPI000EB6800F|nr:coat protein [Salvia divinorum RNA virus 1]AYE54586.1 coat protein [Salvia divinorum RNA virus 1]
MSEFKLMDRAKWPFWSSLIDGLIRFAEENDSMSEGVVEEFLLGSLGKNTIEEDPKKNELVYLRLCMKLISRIISNNARHKEEIRKIESDLGKRPRKEVEVESENEKLKKIIAELHMKISDMEKESERSESETEKDRNAERRFFAGGTRSLTNDLSCFYLGEDEFPAVTQSISTEKIATAEQIKRVMKALNIVDEKKFSRMAFEFVISCGSKSTSSKSQYAGTFSIDNISYKRSDIAYAITGTGLTVRRFCAAYANLYWNYNIRRNQAPENWRDKNFTDETKFAAFDFFYAVGSNAAIPTEPNGDVNLIRNPTKEENEANDAVKWVKIAKAKSQSMGHVTSSMFLNKGVAYNVPKSGSLSITEI